METFITTICTVVGNTTTCEYGGVLLYTGILSFLITVSILGLWAINKIITKLL